MGNLFMHIYVDADACPVVDIVEKTNDILEFLLGERYYDEMAASGLSFGVIDLEPTP